MVRSKKLLKGRHTFSAISLYQYLYLKREDSPGAVVFYSEEAYCLDFAIFCGKGKLNVECNRKRYHPNGLVQDRDRGGDNELTASGWSIIRFSGRKSEDCLKVIKNLPNLRGVKKKGLSII